MDSLFKLKDTLKNYFSHLILNFKYSHFWHNINFKLENKILFILISTYLIFMFVQFTLFSPFFYSNGISPASKGQLTIFSYKHKDIKDNIEIKIHDYISKLETCGKKISVPFHLN